ncbi:MAG: hypothetical protein KAX10_03560 [Candidatus Lokiarchaeota archaeon]|nr:hypothetical protein [Candidatus Lokiarchaeota archaeon]
MKILKKLLLIWLLCGLILTFELKMTKSIETQISDNVYDTESISTMSGKIEDVGVDITINLTYYLKYYFDTKPNFTLFVYISQLNGYLVPKYIQIFYKLSKGETYQFLNILGGIAYQTQPFLYNFNSSSTSNVGENKSANVWIRFGYSINGTEFAQYETVNKTENQVEIVCLEDSGEDSDEGKIWFLWFPLEPYEFIIVIVVIASVVILSIIIVKLKKKKSKQMNNKNIEEKNMN